jgi:hypothetical protein
MKILDMLKIPKYLSLSIFLAVILFFIYAYIQIFGILENFTFWLEVSPWTYLISLVVFVVLFGISSSYQLYTIKRVKVCSVRKEMKGAGTSWFGAISFIFVASCPGCASLGLLLIPVSLVNVVTQYNWVINLFSIALLLFVLNYLGAFKK